MDRGSDSRASLSRFSASSAPRMALRPSASASSSLRSGRAMASPRGPRAPSGHSTNRRGSWRDSPAARSSSLRRWIWWDSSRSRARCTVMWPVSLGCQPPAPTRWRPDATPPPAPASPSSSSSSPDDSPSPCPPDDPMPALRSMARRALARARHRFFMLRRRRRAAAASSSSSVSRPTPATSAGSSSRWDTALSFASLALVMCAALIIARSISMRVDRPSVCP
mmetsp:Transcript_10037/g.39063  ORF Transcript_10037/g.39063 Transcript_10037/m.39063 type:complete len:223 (-) Transcript_10037:190-858(-)